MSGFPRTHSKLQQSWGSTGASGLLAWWWCSCLHTAWGVRDKGPPYASLHKMLCTQLFVHSFSKYLWEFPGRPVVRTPCSHCRGPRFNPWSGN